ncbi:tetratricopeptide repeat protein [Marinobacter sp. CHS3-4]|uniref:tetratricopeptide repeat protein n=1 Tax=Marinobacter sp. CHS3-4 TaxID=3045174 RepID=UPI0024B4EB7B|nr:tetratricopeptide repeat protein [Marinobacter sp. CHS3-4]MDI9245542.1 tetratricopeptide repeat protein [Marinobacter sp. CHS3-4]
MTRSYCLVFLGVLLVGCAGSPSKNLSETDAVPQKRQAVKTEPLTDAQQAQMESAREALDLENWASARSVLEALKTQRPKVSEIHAYLGWVARQQGEKEGAIEAYRTAFDLDPYDAVSANNLALLLREQGKFQAAVSLLQEGLEYSPNVADLHYNLAVIAELYLLDLELALRHYRAFRELNGQDSQQVAGWIADLERRLN